MMSKVMHEYSRSDTPVAHVEICRQSQAQAGPIMHAFNQNSQIAPHGAHD